jgi:hypothetical protein
MTVKGNFSQAFFKIDIIGTFDMINPTILIVDNLVLRWEAEFWNSKETNLKRTPKTISNLNGQLS